jgi:hypothetical protein
MNAVAMFFHGFSELRGDRIQFGDNRACPPQIGVFGLDSPPRHSSHLTDEESEDDGK